MSEVRVIGLDLAKHGCQVRAVWVAWWSCKYGVSYCELEEMLEERGFAVDHTTIYRSTQRYAFPTEKRLR